MFGTLRNITALVAVLAVALLGSLAISNRASERDMTTRQAIMTICEKQTVARQQANEAIKVINVNRQGLQDALSIAENEKNQRNSDQIKYARIESALNTIPEIDPLETTQCDNLFEDE